MGKPPCYDGEDLKKGPWTDEEDQKLIDYIQKNGHGKWRTLPKNAGLKRCGKSCRLRWTNYLRPDIKRGKFAPEEEEAIIQSHRVLGNKWSAIAARLPGRTDNEIKNYWNTHIKKKLLRMGIDPVTHTSRRDILHFSSLLSLSLLGQTSHLNVPNPLSYERPPLDPNTLFNLVATLLPCHNKSLTQEQSQQGIGDSQLQDPNQRCLQSSNQQPQMNLIQACTSGALGSQSLNEAQLNNQAILKHFPTDSIKPWPPSNGELRSYKPPAVLTDVTDYNDYNNRSIDDSSVNGLFPRLSSDGLDSIDAAGLSASSILCAAPSYSSTPLNSSFTNGNNVRGGSEDERDSYCSNMFLIDFAISGPNES